MNEILIVCLSAIILVLVATAVGVIAFKRLFVDKKEYCITYYEIGGIKTDLDDALGIQKEMARYGYKLPIYRIVNGKVVGKIRYGI
jgi:hypothetical protein